MTSLQDSYGWRAGIRENPVMRSLEVTVGEVYPEVVTYVTSIGSGGVEKWQAERGTYDGQSLNMPMDMARALHDALAEYFGDTSSARQLRADFVHERDRVDKLIDTITKIATDTAPVEVISERG